MEKVDVLIVGGGLSGLSLADMLADRGIDYKLIEARERLGGRILSVPATDGERGDERYDLGPAWFWPGQHRMEALIERLGLSWFEQASVGTLVMQEQNGSVRRDLNFSTMAGSRRIVGGAQRLVEALADRVSDRDIALNSQLKSLTMGDREAIAEIEQDGRPQTLRARSIALAIPPRIAARSVAFEPPLGDPMIARLSSIPTWMAGQAKVVAIYDRPFWRDAGLSGDGMSRMGPLVEIHDASPQSGDEGALFGFVGIRADARRGRSHDVTAAAIYQLTQMFGDEASRPKQILYQDWAEEVFTSTIEDSTGLQHHPQYGLLPPLGGPWDQNVHFASAESAPDYGGYLEGALEAAEHVFGLITIKNTYEKEDAVRRDSITV